MKQYSELNYHDRIFRVLRNSDAGETSEATTFHYRQEGKIIWATYSGGAILFGTLSGRINPTGELEFYYQHQNLKGIFMAGKCQSKPEILPDGRIRLFERWQWITGDHSKGESVIEELE